MLDTQRRALLFAVIALPLAACTPAAGTPDTGQDQPIDVYATTGYLADAVAVIAPEASITTMVGPGGDPHAYQPSTRDIQRIQTSDVVFWNGLHLEAQMIDQLTSLGELQLAVGDLVPEHLLLSWPDTDEEGNPLHDPHIWNSPAAWSVAVGHVARKLAEVDPDNAETYRTNVRLYLEDIAAAAQETKDLLEKIPAGERILITGHDAFAYFGETYDLEVHATDFISTEARLSAGELSGLADLIAREEVSVIFQDNLANPQAIISLKEAVRSRGWQVEVSKDELYADSLGPEPGVDTYLGVHSHNARAIATALIPTKD